MKATWRQSRWAWALYRALRELERWEKIANRRYRRYAKDEDTIEYYRAACKEAAAYRLCVDRLLGSLAKKEARP